MEWGACLAAVGADLIKAATEVHLSVVLKVVTAPLLARLSSKAAVGGVALLCLLVSVMWIKEINRGLLLILIGLSYVSDGWKELCLCDGVYSVEMLSVLCMGKIKLSPNRWYWFLSVKCLPSFSSAHKSIKYSKWRLVFFVICFFFFFEINFSFWNAFVRTMDFSGKLLLCVKTAYMTEVFPDPPWGCRCLYLSLFEMFPSHCCLYNS